MRPMFSRFGLFLAGLTLLTPAERAQTMAFTVPPGGVDANAGRDLFGGSLGLLFTVNTSFTLTISSLGYWDDGQNGLSDRIANGNNAPVNVALFTRSGTPVAGAAITFNGSAGTLTGNLVDNQLNSDGTSGVPPTSSGRTGQFRLANLVAPIILPAGQYELVTWGYDFYNQYLNGSNDGPVFDVNTFSGALTFDGSAFGSGAPGSFPNTPDPSSGIVPLYVAATFSPDTVSAIPEPAAVALVLGASVLTGAFLVRHRRRRLAAKLAP